MQIIAALEDTNDIRSVNPLIQALNDNDSHVRGIAAEALGKLKDKSALDPLSDVLKDDNSGVRKRGCISSWKDQ